MRWARFALAAALTAALPQAARAAVIDFSQALGGADGRYQSNVFSAGPVTVEAFYLDRGAYTSDAKRIAGQWREVRLFVRNEPNDHGFGVCNPREIASRACRPPDTYAGGGGETNELDDAGTPELLRVSLAAGWTWESLWVSSLDGRERGEIRYSDDASLSRRAVRRADLLLAYRHDPGEAFEVELPVTGAARTARFLFVIPGPHGRDNDHLLWQAAVTQVPEPGTLALVATGVAAIGVARARRRWL
jgi:hypothetical protein